MRLYWWPTEQWRLFSYWGEILLVICPLLFHLTPSLLTGCDSLFYSPSALPPHSLSSPLFPAFSLIVSHHDSIHNVILVVFQRTDGFGSWHIGLSHHQLNVSLLKASLIHLMYRKKERSKDKERFQNIRFNGCWNRYSETIVQKIPPLLPLHSPPWWWDWVGQVGLREKRSQAPWISLRLLCEPAETGPQSEERKGPNK